MKKIFSGKYCSLLRIYCSALCFVFMLCNHTSAEDSYLISHDRTLSIVEEMAQELILQQGFTAGSGYSEVWIRDFYTFTELACGVFPKETVAEALTRFFHFQGEDGNIPDGVRYVGDEARTMDENLNSPSMPNWVSHKNTVETDQESSLVLAVAQYIDSTGDNSILETDINGMTVLQRLEAAMDYLARHRTSETYGLLWGATTVDWGDVQPEHTWGVYLDENSHKAVDIYDNALYILALEKLAQMSREPSNQEKFKNTAETIRRNAKLHLWDAETGKFIPHLYLDSSPFPPDFNENAIWYHGGTGIAIEAGILTKNEIAAAIENMAANKQKSGAQTIGLTVWPPYPAGFFQNAGLKPGQYQNGGDWTWYGARIVHALIKEGFISEAYRELRPMLDRVLSNNGFYEWYTRDGIPAGSGQYKGEAGVLWSAVKRLRELSKTTELNAAVFPFHDDTWSFPGAIKFGIGGNAEAYQKHGFSKPEEGFTWTQGKNAVIAFKIPEARDGRLYFKVTCFPFSGRNQTVNVFVNGSHIETWMFEQEDQTTKQFSFPSSLAWNGRVLINFELKNAISPLELGISNDDRLLAIAFKEISYDEILELPDVINFGLGGNAEAYQKHGFSHPEDGFTWTLGNAAVIAINSSEKDDITLSCDVFPFCAEGLQKQRVVIFVNGVEHAFWEISEPEEKSLSIPASLIQNGHVRIEFRLPDAKSPKELGMGEDSRKLALSFKKITKL